jgi:hypothetical protein
VGKLLIAAGANVTLMNKKGSTPLHTLSYCSTAGLPFADFTDLLVNAAASPHGKIHTTFLLQIV